MLPFIEKIIYRKADKLYFRFEDGLIKVIDKKTIIKDMPDWQIKIVNERWDKVKISEGCLYFNKTLEIGGDSIYHLSKELSREELFEIIQNKRIAKKKIIQALASLL